jgi:hypothetical protein
MYQRFFSGRAGVFITEGVVVVGWVERTLRNPTKNEKHENE